MESFNPGQVVRVKSGGPAMTVMHSKENGRVACEWFDKEQKHQEAMFNTTSLKALDTGDY